MAEEHDTQGITETGTAVEAGAESELETTAPQEAPKAEAEKPKI